MDYRLVAIVVLLVVLVGGGYYYYKNMNCAVAQRQDATSLIKNWSQLSTTVNGARCNWNNPPNKSDPNDCVYLQKSVCEGAGYKFDNVTPGSPWCYHC